VQGPGNVLPGLAIFLGPLTSAATKATALLHRQVEKLHQCPGQCRWIVHRHSPTTGTGDVVSVSENIGYHHGALKRPGGTQHTAL